MFTEFSYPLFSLFHFSSPVQSSDATLEPSGKEIFGRLVNHGDAPESNARMKVITVSNQPALCLFATKLIPKDSEVLYDYGIKKLPWKTQVSPLK